MSDTFSPELTAKVAELRKRYPDPKAVLLPALHLIQAERGGWFSEETIADAAELLGIPDMHVRGVVGFYDMFHTQPVGRHVVRLCKTLSASRRSRRSRTVPSASSKAAWSVGTGPVRMSSAR